MKTLALALLGTVAVFGGCSDSTGPAGSGARRVALSFSTCAGAGAPLASLGPVMAVAAADTLTWVKTS